MIISIASGKGGTGKTTVAVNLALSLDKDLLFLDCDVEEPNANIFLKTRLYETEYVTMDIPRVDESRCDYCGRCAEFCEYNALAVLSSKVMVFPELCHSCGGCKLVCPRDAIRWEERVTGRVEHGVKDNIDFYQGVLNIGESQATPIIRYLKNKISNGRDVIIDSPPGTSCPVIESINESNYCILVTEPTPFGLHDLKLAVDLVRHLSIPFGVIINRYGIGDKRVDLYCQTERIPVLERIPHDEEIAKLYSNGKPFVEELGEWRDRFQRIYEVIEASI